MLKEGLNELNVQMVPTPVPPSEAVVISYSVPSEIKINGGDTLWMKLYLRPRTVAIGKPMYTIYWIIQGGYGVDWRATAKGNITPSAEGEYTVPAVVEREIDPEGFWGVGGKPGDIVSFRYRVHVSWQWKVGYWEQTMIVAETSIPERATLI